MSDDQLDPCNKAASLSRAFNQLTDEVAGRWEADGQAVASFSLRLVAGVFI